MSLKRIDWQTLQGKREEASKPEQLEFSFVARISDNK